ncbi:DUF1289 domain-containing protein [Falsiroseomonas algicola]|uniref:DUF1289 domain-containing protein n=1 Tax=Falsiroseomonas algicola TaxID=2716930 RepID=UPI001A982B22|nr:DUF1289 domain-containing protein [Falsiroseomonas algicola]
MAEPPDGEVASPCRRSCRYRPDLGLCDGCGRTLAEIEAWPTADAAARRAIIGLAAARLSALGRGGAEG